MPDRMSLASEKLLLRALRKTTAKISWTGFGAGMDRNAQLVVLVSGELTTVYPPRTLRRLFGVERRGEQTAGGRSIQAFCQFRHLKMRVSA